MTIEIVKSESRIFYKKNGKYHRIEGPAVIWNDGVEEYCVNGYWHRIEGPAYVDDSGDYYVNSVNYKKTLFEVKYKPCVLKDGIVT